LKIIETISYFVRQSNSEKYPYCAIKELTMKKGFIGLIMILVLISLSPSIIAASSIPLVIDGVVVKSDARPETKNNRIMVPLRVISENLGAQVNWSGANVTLTKKDLTVTVTKNSSTAIKNGETVTLDVKPYLKNNRLFVPLRFIAETFGAVVGYEYGMVRVEAKPLVIDSVIVSTLQQEYHMTMGGVVSHVLGSAYIETIYHLIMSNSGAVVDEPTSYSWMPNIDVPGSYYKVGQYDFLAKNNTTVQRFDVYGLINAFPADELAGYAPFLVHDVTENQWHVFETTNQVLWNVMDTANQNGFVKTISNNVV
jgi:hypothetical protein